MTNDVIYRQSAIAALGEEPEVRDDLWDYDIARVKQWKCDVAAIKALPPAKPEPQWVLCENSEPDEGAECWVTVKNTYTLYRGCFTKRYGAQLNKGFITSGIFVWWHTAIAWMPVYEPEPYRPEGEEHE